jgi:hypothetical protein
MANVPNTSELDWLHPLLQVQGAINPRSGDTERTGMLRLVGVWRISGELSRFPGASHVVRRHVRDGTWAGPLKMPEYVYP